VRRKCLSHGNCHCSRSARARRIANAMLSEIAGARAFRTFCTPHLSSYRSADHDRLVERARHHLRSAHEQRLATGVGKVQTYVIAPARQSRATVLLVHGWTGEAAFMGAFADYLRRRGLRAVLLDLPAHGRSRGRSTTLMDCAHAVREVAAAMGPVRFVIGHSIGGLAALLAGEGRPPLPGPYVFEAYVLIAVPDRFADVTRRYGEERRMTPTGLRAFERRLERLAGRQIADFTACHLLAAVDRPTLLLHARNDQEVPFADAERLAASAPRAELHPFDDLGHRAILYAPLAARAAAAFFDRWR
jgi:pimeloyl-ACP methyl ester carboxylesterase